MRRVLTVTEFYPDRDYCRRINIYDRKTIEDIIKLVHKTKKNGKVTCILKTNPGARFIKLSLTNKKEPSKVLCGYSVTYSTLSVFENGEDITYWTNCIDLQDYLLNLVGKSPKITMEEWHQYTIKCLYIRNLYDVLRNILEIKKVESC